MAKFASLCVLSYKRPALLTECLASIISTADYPYQLIVNSDGGDEENFDYLTKMLHQGRISNLILNGGKNRGVGRSFQNCLGVAEGDYIFKVDTDLTFKPNWISNAVKILDSNTEVGAVGLFDYNKWDSVDSRFTPEENVIEDMKTWDFEYKIVKDFVSSIYAFRSVDRHLFEGHDDGFHTDLQRAYGKLALKHMVNNTAFGVGRSTYVSGTMDHPFKTPTEDRPLII